MVLRGIQKGTVRVWWPTPCVYVCMCEYVWGCISMCVHICVYMWGCITMCVHICVYICVCVYHPSGTQTSTCGIFFLHPSLPQSFRWVFNCYIHAVNPALLWTLGIQASTLMPFSRSSHTLQLPPPHSSVRLALHFQNHLQGPLLEFNLSKSTSEVSKQKNEREGD